MLRVSAVVLAVLAAAIGLGVLFLLVPTNADNGLVSGTLELADQVAGPFRDVFTDDDAETEQVVNYAFAAGVHLAGAAVLKRVADAPEGLARSPLRSEPCPPPCSSRASPSRSGRPPRSTG